MKFVRIRANKSRARTLIAESHNLISASQALHKHARELHSTSAHLVGEIHRRYAEFHLLKQRLGDKSHWEGNTEQAIMRSSNGAGPAKEHIGTQ